jgi:phage baseplate assembly protein W
MSYILPKRIVKDTEDALDNNAYGIDYPVTVGSNMFKSTFTLANAARANIRNLLQTRKGERIMQPEFGTGLDELLFEPMTGEFETKVQKEITNSINYWLPYVTIEEIEIEMTDEMKDRNRATLNLTFRVGESIDLNQVSLSIQG